MARTRTRTPQQRDARELALTRPSDPYRGALSDPFTVTAPSVPAGTDGTGPGVSAGADPGLGAGVAGTAGSTAAVPGRVEPPRRPGMPGEATFAGILGIVLGLALGLFGLLLVTIVSLQDQYGAPDRSYYRGTDSGYVVLGLIDFGLAVLCGIGGTTMLTGRVLGRVAVTVGGWACLMLAGYWLVNSTVAWFVPVAVAAVAAAMLFAAYTRRVSRWLGVLLPPQPE